MGNCLQELPNGDSLHADRQKLPVCDARESSQTGIAKLKLMSEKSKLAVQLNHLTARFEDRAQTSKHAFSLGVSPGRHSTMKTSWKSSRHACHKCSILHQNIVKVKVTAQVCK